MEENQEQKDGEYPIFTLSQAEAEYTTASTSPELQCATCRFFSASDSSCYIVQNTPYPIVSGGSCKMHMPIPMPAMVEDEMGEASDIDMGEMAAKPKPAFLNGDDEETDENPKPKKALDLLQSATNAISGLLPTLSKWLNPDISETPETSGFKVLEDNRFLAFWTNNFKDKEAEIISEYAIDEFNNKANSGLIPMPELWWMHTKGTRHGQVEKLFRVGHFALAVGRFDAESTNPLVKIFKQWYAKQKNITMSHGFFYKPSLKTNGVYHHIRTYEISSLIAGREANPYTTFEVNKMSLITENQRADLEREFGKDFAERIVSQAEAQGKALESQDIAFKSLPSGFGAETLLVLGAVKVVEDDAKKASNEATDVGNRLNGVEQKMGNYADSVIRLTEKVDELTNYLKQLTNIQPPASRSPLSTIKTDDKEANFLQKKNEEQGKAFVPILSQMKAMGEFENFTPPTNPE